MPREGALDDMLARQRKALSRLRPTPPPIPPERDTPPVSTQHGPLELQAHTLRTHTRSHTPSHLPAAAAAAASHRAEYKAVHEGGAGEGGGCVTRCWGDERDGRATWLQAYMCPHTAMCVYICVRICYICVRILLERWACNLAADALLYMCPHTAIYLSI